VDQSNINYLLSAMLQAGAALVAIVGGLVAARYVSLHAEISQVRAEVDELSVRETNAHESFWNALFDHTRSADRAVLYRTDYLLRFIRFPHRTSSLVERLEEVAVANERESDAKWVVARATLYFDEARKLLTERVDPQARLVSPWKDFARGKRLVFDDDFREFIHEFVYEYERATREFKYQKQGDTLAPMKALDSLVDRANSDLRARLPSLEQEWLRRDEEATLVRNQLNAAQRRLAGLRESEGFGTALEVRSLLAIATIVVPLVAMLPDYGDYTQASRIVFVAIFILGLLLMGRYLYVYAAHLRGAREAMPKHVLGLIIRQPGANADREGATR